MSSDRENEEKLRRLEQYLRQGLPPKQRGNTLRPRSTAYHRKVLEHMVELGWLEPSFPPATANPRLEDLRHVILRANLSDEEYADWQRQAAGFARERLRSQHADEQHPPPFPALEGDDT
jgi:hypothetical protein